MLFVQNVFIVFKYDRNPKKQFWIKHKVKKIRIELRKKRLNNIFQKTIINTHTNLIFLRIQKILSLKNLN